MARNLFLEKVVFFPAECISMSKKSQRASSFEFLFIESNIFQL